MNGRTFYPRSYDTRLLQEIVDHVGIDCLANTINSRPGGRASGILSAIMEGLKDDSIITAAVEPGVLKSLSKGHLGC